MSIRPVVRRSAAFLLAISLLGLVSCAEKDPKSPKFIVAEGKGVKVTRGDLDTETDLFLKQRGAIRDQVPADKIAQLEENILERIVISQLLETEAKGVKIPDLDEKIKAEGAKLKKLFPDETAYKAEMEKAGMTDALVSRDLRRQVLFRSVIDLKVPESGDPKPEEIEAFYKDNPKNFAQPNMVKASHVLIKSSADATPAAKAERKKIADAARARVVKGEPFSKVARETSEDPGSAQQGGDLGFFQRGEMVPEFDKAAFGSKVGAVSPVFETPFGFHFLTVTGVQESKIIPLDEATPQISKYLRDRDRARRVDEYVKSIKDNAKVVTKLENGKPALKVTTPPPEAK